MTSPPAYPDRSAGSEKLGKAGALNKKYGIQAGYQNHSGMGVGAPLWDLRELLQDLPPQWKGSQFDIRHAVTEGAYS